MYDALGVKVFDGEHRLRRPRHGLAERERALVGKSLVQVASRKIFHREDHTATSKKTVEQQQRWRRRHVVWWVNVVSGEGVNDDESPPGHDGVKIQQYR